jgi:hypothetical protein
MIHLMLKVAEWADTQKGCWTACTKEQGPPALSCCASSFSLLLYSWGVGFTEPNRKP